MSTLTLQIKREFLDKILSGEKTEEFREIRPKNSKKYIEYIQAENDEDVQPIQYKQIQFFNGYAKDRPEVMIKVKKSIIQIIEDENGEDIVYEEDGQEYVVAQMVYSLGKIISRKNI